MLPMLSIAVTVSHWSRMPAVSDRLNGENHVPVGWLVGGRDDVMQYSNALSPTFRRVPWLPRYIRPLSIYANRLKAGIIYPVIMRLPL